MFRRGRRSCKFQSLGPTVPKERIEGGGNNFSFPTRRQSRPVRVHARLIDTGDKNVSFRGYFLLFLFFLRRGAST